MKWPNSAITLTSAGYFSCNLFAEMLKENQTQELSGHRLSSRQQLADLVFETFTSRVNILTNW